MTTPATNLANSTHEAFKDQTATLAATLHDLGNQIRALTGNPGPNRHIGIAVQAQSLLAQVAALAPAMLTIPALAADAAAQAADEEAARG